MKTPKSNKFFEKSEKMLDETKFCQKKNFAKKNRKNWYQFLSLKFYYFPKMKKNKKTNNMNLRTGFVKLPLSRNSAATATSAAVPIGE